MPDMYWPDAIRKVLQEAEEPLHYKEIADIIGREEMVKTRGATPENTVIARLSDMLKDGEKIEKVKPGYYVLLNLPKDSKKKRRLEEVESQEDDRDSTQVRISAYGLYWERDQIIWQGKGSRKILGKQPSATVEVNFADQQGVYLLHDIQTVTYVGRTNAKEKGLFARLKAHVNNPRRVGRWDRFSWFGFRPVSNEGELGCVPNELEKDSLITILESVLIETHLPPFNDKVGDLMGDLYEQVIDPEIAQERARELLRNLVGTGKAK